MKVDGRGIFKGVAKFVGSMGVGTLVTLGLKQNIISKSTYEKIMVAIGSFVISDMISSKAEEYLDGQVDEVFAFVDKIKGEPVKEIGHVKFDENGLPIEETMLEEEEK